MEKLLECLPLHLIKSIRVSYHPTSPWLLPSVTSQLQHIRLSWTKTYLNEFWLHVTDKTIGVTKTKRPRVRQTQHAPKRASPFSCFSLSALWKLQGFWRDPSVFIFRFALTWVFLTFHLCNMSWSQTGLFLLQPGHPCDWEAALRLHQEAWVSFLWNKLTKKRKWHINRTLNEAGSTRLKHKHLQTSIRWEQGTFLEEEEKVDCVLTLCLESGSQLRRSHFRLASSEALRSGVWVTLETSLRSSFPKKKAKSSDPSYGHWCYW